MSALVSKLNIDDTTHITKTFVPGDVTIGTDTITITSHGFSDDDIVYFSGSDIPAGLIANTKYYIVNSTINTFKVSTSVGGTGVDITSTGTGTHTVTSNYNFSGSTDFGTIQTEYNDIAEKLEASSGVFFTDYPRSSGTTDQESIINSIDTVNTTVTTNTTIPFITGDIILYKSINTKTTWSPEMFQDVSSTKHVRSGTFIFEDNNFTKATISYATDNSPSFEEILYGGDSIGDWGQFGWGQQYWGGVSSAKPMRTLIPLEKQRCRFMIPRFEHSVAREKFSLYGLSLTFRMIGPRGYR